jgi:hypothetical protein
MKTGALLDYGRDNSAAKYTLVKESGLSIVPKTPTPMNSLMKMGCTTRNILPLEVTAYRALSTHGTFPFPRNTTIGADFGDHPEVRRPGRPQSCKRHPTSARLQEQALLLGRYHSSLKATTDILIDNTFLSYPSLRVASSLPITHQSAERWTALAARNLLPWA